MNNLIGKLRTLVDNGLDMYRAYDNASTAALSENNDPDDEKVLNLMLAKSYYQGQIDALYNIKLLLETETLENAEAIN